MTKQNCQPNADRLVYLTFVIKQEKGMEKYMKEKREEIIITNKKKKELKKGYKKVKDFVALGGF